MDEPYSYWIELRKHADNLEVSHLIKELSEANSKVRYYERMLDQINQYRNIVTSK